VTPASAEEAAAVVAALEQFRRATAPPPAPAPDQRLSAWSAEALREGVDRWPLAPGPWLWSR